VKAITFERQMPARWVLLVAPVADARRPGSGSTVPGTDSFKPAGSDWATEDDLNQAGYVSAASLEGAASGVAEVLRRDDLSDELRGALAAVGEKLVSGLEPARRHFRLGAGGADVLVKPDGDQ